MSNYIVFQIWNCPRILQINSSHIIYVSFCRTSLCLCLRGRRHVVSCSSLSLSGFGARGVLASEDKLRRFPLLRLWWDFVKDSYYSVFKYLVEFTSEIIWIWSFICWKICSYQFNFSNRLRTIRVYSRASFDGLCLSRNLSVLSKL